MRGIAAKRAGSPPPGAGPRIAPGRCYVNACRRLALRRAIGSRCGPTSLPDGTHAPSGTLPQRPGLPSRARAPRAGARGVRGRAVGARPRGAGRRDHRAALLRHAGRRGRAVAPHQRAGVLSHPGAARRVLAAPRARAHHRGRHRVSDRGPGGAPVLRAVDHAPDARARDRRGACDRGHGGAVLVARGLPHAAGRRHLGQRGRPPPGHAHADQPDERHGDPLLLDPATGRQGGHVPRPGDAHHAGAHARGRLSRPVRGVLRGKATR